MPKKIRELKAMLRKVDFLWHIDEKVYVVFVHELPGCVAGGKTRLEAVQHSKMAIKQHVDELEAAGLSVPTPIFTIATFNKG